MIIELTRDDCYTEINTFYKIIASKMGFKNVDELIFDCRDIVVTPRVYNTISEFYYKERGAGVTDFAYIWACFGPKTTLVPSNMSECYQAEVGRKFITQEEQYNEYI